MTLLAITFALVVVAGVVEIIRRNRAHDDAPNHPGEM